MFPNMNRRSLPSRQRGVMLIIAIFIMTVLLLVGVVITEIVTNASRSASFEVFGIRAFQAANSGAEIGLNRIFPPEGGGTGCSNTMFSQTPSVNFSGNDALNGCSVNVRCTSFDVAETGYRHYRVEATATCSAGDFETQRSVAVEAREIF